MTEYLDIFDEQGNPTGQRCEKSRAHEQGLWHKSVHLWIINSRGELLLRQRGSTETKEYDHVWENPAAGHVSAGETPESATVRETQEETGLTISEKDLAHIFSYKRDADGNKELVDVFLAMLDLDIGGCLNCEGDIVKAIHMHWRDFAKTRDASHPYNKKLFAAIEEKGF